MLSLRAWRPEEDWPDVSDRRLLETLEDWLGPWLGGVSRREDLARLDLAGILAGLLPWPLPARLDELAPTRLTVPSGSSIRLSYRPDGSPPVLAVRIQEMFGLADTPRVNEGRTPVLLHLLSPAYRPVQVTQDLRSFWANTYPELRKEPRGRYNNEAALVRILDLTRELYNAALQERREAWRKAGKSVTVSDQMRLLGEVKAVRPEYREVYAQVLQETLKRLDRAFQGFFRRVE